MSNSRDESLNAPSPQLAEGAEDRLRELDEADCCAATRAALRAIILGGSDIDCYKINVIRIARERGVSVRECLRAFLFATELGILDLNYDVYCPSCRGNTEYTKHLMGLRGGGHCDFCTIDFGLDYLEQVEVTFTVNPNIRQLAIEQFSNRDDSGAGMHLCEILEREERKPTADEWFEPGESKSFTADLTEPSGYVFYLPGYHRTSAVISVSGEPREEVETLKVRVDASGGLDPERIAIRPGPVEFVVDFHYPRGFPLLVMARTLPKNWLSAAYVTSQQDFRDLFAGEFLAPGVSFSIRNTTLMFTDIRKSTELFEELGDSAAYALVQDHFQVMADIIRTREGGIVKTIGDAVMASFPVNRDAVAAACEIQRSFVGCPIKGRHIEVKIGLHRGPTIAVTSNRNLDFFGRTVNIAARVQGKSGANELLVSDAVIDDPEVRTLLENERAATDTFTTSLKGIGDEFRLHSIVPGAA